MLTFWDRVHGVKGEFSTKVTFETDITIFILELRKLRLRTFNLPRLHSKWWACSFNSNTGALTTSLGSCPGLDCDLTTFLKV